MQVTFSHLPPPCSIGPVLWVCFKQLKKKEYKPELAQKKGISEHWCLVCTLPLSTDQTSAKYFHCSGQASDSEDSSKIYGPTTSNQCPRQSVDEGS